MSDKEKKSFLHKATQGAAGAVVGAAAAKLAQRKKVTFELPPEPELEEQPLNIEEPDPIKKITGESEENTKENHKQQVQRNEIIHANDNSEHFQSNPDKYGKPGLPFDKNNPVRFGFLAATGAILAYFIFEHFATLSSVMFWLLTALFVALGLEPVVQLFVRKGLPRWAGVVTVTLIALVLFSIFISNLVPTIVNQITLLVNNMPQYIQTAMSSQWFHDLDAKFNIRHIVEDNSQKFMGQLGSSAGNITQTLLGAGAVISNGFFGMFMVLVLTIYFLSSMPAFKAFIYRLVPASRRQRFQPLTEEIIRGVSGYVSGQAVVAFINASFACAVMTLLGMPFIVLLTFLVVILAFIPLIGATVALIFVTLIASTISWQTAAIFAISYMLYLQVETYVIYPNVMKKAVAVPPPVSIVAILVGGTLLGVLGAVVAIPIAAAVMLILREVVIPRQDRI